MQEGVGIEAHQRSDRNHAETGGGSDRLEASNALVDSDHGNVL